MDDFAKALRWFRRTLIIYAMAALCSAVLYVTGASIRAAFTGAAP